MPPTSPSNWQPGFDTSTSHDYKALESSQLDNEEYSSIHLDTLPSFAVEIETAIRSKNGHQVEGAARLIASKTPRKFKIRSAQKVATSSPGVPVRMFQIGGKKRQERTAHVRQSMAVQHTVIPRIIVTQPSEPPTNLAPTHLDGHPKTDHHQATTSLLEVPSQQNGFNAFTRSLPAPLVSRLDLKKGNFAPSSPHGKKEWLSKWAEKESSSRRRASVRDSGVQDVKECMRVEDGRVFLPTITTETPRARRLNCFGEDYCLNTPKWTVSESSRLDKWREKDDETFELLDEKEEEEACADQDGMFTQAGNTSTTNKNTDPTTDDAPETNNKLNQAAIVADMCQKWGPDCFDRWCEEYATPISETIWNEASTDLEEFSGVQSEPAPVQDQKSDRVVFTPRYHSLPYLDPPKRYLRTRRSMQATQCKDDGVARLRLMRLSLDRWIESRDTMCYDSDFLDSEEHE